MPGPETKTLQAKLLSIGRTPNDSAWALQFPKEGKSKYPTTLYTQDDEMVEGLLAGQVLSLHLARGNLKEGKTGQYDSDYFWDIQGIGHLGDAPAVVTPSAPREPSNVKAYAKHAADPRQGSIERQVAFKKTVDLIIAGKIVPSEGQKLYDLILSYTNAFCKVLEGK